MKRSQLFAACAALVLAACSGKNNSTGSTSGSSGSSGSTGTSSGSTGSSGSSGTTTSSSGSSGTTGNGAPTNDLCSAPIALDKGVSLTGDTTPARNDYTLAPGNTCTSGAAEGNDLVYAFTPPATGRYQITVTPRDASVTTGPALMLYVLDHCPAPGAIDSCLAGVNNGSNGVTESLVVQLTQGTPYFIFVDGLSSSDNGPFTLLLDDAPAAPANDLCANAQSLTATDPGMSQALTASTQGAGDEGHASCGGSGPDVYYALHLNQTAHLKAVLTQPAGGTLSPVLSLFHGCGFPASGEIACTPNGVPPSPGDSSTLDVAGLTVGDYILVVDGYLGSSGPFTLDVTLTPPPPGDQCSAPNALGTLQAGQTLSAQGTTYGAVDDLSSALCGDHGPDVFYDLTIGGSEPVHLTATAQPVSAAGGPLLGAIVDLDSDCSGTETACSDSAHWGEPAVLDLPSVQPGSYKLVVDSYAGTSGPFNLSVTAGSAVPPPVADTCAGNASVPLASRPDGGFIGSVTFDALGAGNDTSHDPSGQCRRYGYPSGADLVYHVALASPAPRLTATYLDPDGGIDPGTAALLVRGAPCFDSFYPADGGSAPAQELACGTGLVVATSLDGGALSAGDYYIVIDGVRVLPPPAGTLQVTVP